VEVYPDPTKAAIVHPYMKHSVFKTVSQIQFCPYEDILGTFDTVNTVNRELGKFRSK